jgi:hypothetical protein
MKKIEEGSVEGMLEFLQELVDTQAMSSGQIVPLRSALRKVLSTVDGEDWRQRGVYDIDIELYMARFNLLTRTSYTDQSISAYKSRISKAIFWYKKRLDDPEWVPTSEVGSVWIQHGTTGKFNGPQSWLYRSEGANKAVTVRSSDAWSSTHNQQVKEADFITYPFPLSEGRVARLNLPQKLNREDVARLGAFLNSLVVGEKEGFM